MSEEISGLIQLTIFLVVMFLFYVLPTIIASRRKHKNALAIFALNITTGWTVIGWIICLVWSLTSYTDT